MARIIGYIAASLDGYIAGQGDTMDWLAAYDGIDLGEHDYASFIARVRTIVMGRATYDFLEQSEADWPYGAHQVFVVTSRPITGRKGPVETRQDIDRLIDEMRTLDEGPVWMLGGGAPLFPTTGLRSSLRLISATTLDRGCVRLHYSFE